MRETVICRRTCRNNRTVSGTNLTSNPSKPLLSFLTQIPYSLRRNLFLYRFKLQILTLTHKAVHTHHFPHPQLSVHLPVPSVLLTFDSLGRGNKRLEGVPLFDHALLSIHQQKWKQTLNYSESLKIFQSVLQEKPSYPQASRLNCNAV